MNMRVLQWLAFIAMLAVSIIMALVMDDQWGGGLKWLLGGLWVSLNVWIWLGMSKRFYISEMLIVVFSIGFQMMLIQTKSEWAIIAYALPIVTCLLINARRTDEERFLIFNPLETEKEKPTVALNGSAP